MNGDAKTRCCYLNYFAHMVCAVLMISRISRSVLASELPYLSLVSKAGLLERTSSQVYLNRILHALRLWLQTC